MYDLIIINILLVILLVIFATVISANIYDKFKKCCSSCDTFLQQEEQCSHCNYCESSRVSIQHTNIIINEECPICITDNNSHSISLTCNHTYHSKCINPWVQQCKILEKIPMCPLCNANII